MTAQQPTIKEIEELFGEVNFEQLVKDELLAVIKEEENKRLMSTLYGSSFADGVMTHPEVYKTLNRVKFEMTKAMEKYLFSRKYVTKKIKRRLHYDVWYWSKNGDSVTRVSKYFESAMKAKKYVNHIHNSGLVQEYDYVRMQKTWCYREHHPKHKWFYISFEPNQFLCVEKW